MTETQPAENELAPENKPEGAREGADLITYLEGAFAVCATVGGLELVGFAIYPPETLALIGGIGIAGAILYEWRVE